MDAIINRTRDKRMDCLKGLAITLVVVGHILQFGFSGYEDSLFFNIIWSLQIPLFVVVSGYFAGKGTLKNIKNKAIVYLVPFVSCFVIKLLLIVETSNVKEQIYGLPYHLENSLWYLFVLFELSFIHNIALFICNKLINSTHIIVKYTTYTILYGVLLMPQILFALIFGTTFLGCKYVLYYSVFYWIGFIWHEIKTFYNNFDDKFKFKIHKIINVLMAISVVVYFIFIFNYNLYLLSDNLMGIPLRFLTSVLGVFIVIKTVYVVYKDNNKIMIFFNGLGRYTLEIYYLHYLFISKIPQNSFSIFSYEGILYILVFFCITIILSLMFVKIISTSTYLSLIIFGKCYQN